jgi:selenophosphate synthase
VGFTNNENASLYKNILADPQTSGGLLVAISREEYTNVAELMKREGLEQYIEPIGELVKAKNLSVIVN